MTPFFFYASMLFFCSYSTRAVTEAAMNSSLPQGGSVGINYGRLGNNLPSPEAAVAMIKGLGAGYVKIYDTDVDVMSAIARAGLPLVVTATNAEIAVLGSSSSAADVWVQTNLFRGDGSASTVAMVMVGNEVLSDNSSQSLWPLLVPAIKNLQTSLLKSEQTKSIKVSTSVAMDALQISYPPSAGKFREDLTPFLGPLLAFLSETRSFFFLDVYPYLAWVSDMEAIPLEYAMLVGHESSVVMDGSLEYSNLLDAQMDAVVAASAALGYPAVQLALSETGWPNAGWKGANAANAKLYNQMVVQKLLSAVGTPQRPSTFFPSFIFALFNENSKPGPDIERHWGLLHPNGSQVYPISLSSAAQSRKISRSVLEGQGQWCVARSDLDDDDEKVEEAMKYACEKGGKGKCAAIEGDGECVWPKSKVSHASFAFNSCWQQFKASGFTCHFGGLALLTTKDPSYSSCSYAFLES